MSREPPGQTLQATALVHEAYLKLLRSKAGLDRSKALRRHHGARDEADSRRARPCARRREAVGRREPRDAVRDAGRSGTGGRDAARARRSVVAAREPRSRTGAHRRVPLLCRPERRGDRRRARPLGCDREAPLGAGACLALSRAQERRQARCAASGSSCATSSSGRSKSSLPISPHGWPRPPTIRTSAPRSDRCSISTTEAGEFLSEPVQDRFPSLVDEDEDKRGLPSRQRHRALHDRARTRPRRDGPCLPRHR